jgi:uncharacterized protein with HEPN domain
MKDDKFFFIHMLESIDNIEKYAKLGEYEFSENSMMQDAILRNLEILGEAAKNLSQNARDNLPEIDWKGIIGMRNLLAHEYFRIDKKMIWGVVIHELPKLKASIKTPASLVLPPATSRNPPPHGG